MAGENLFSVTYKLVKRSRLLILLLTMFALTACSNLLYYPTDIKYVNEKKLKYPPSEIFFEHNKNTSLAAWYFEAPKEIRKNVTFVFFHGNGQNLSSHFYSLYWILEHGYNFLIFDYIGYGLNSGIPTPRNTVETGKSAIDWVKLNRPHDRIGIFGQSLGGNVALRTLSESESSLSCLNIIESSFLSYQEMAKVVMQKGWLTWPLQWLSYLLISDSYSINTNLNKLPESNYIIVHGREDSIVPFELGQQLFEKLPNKKEFWSIEGGNHSDAFTRKKDNHERLLKEIKKYCL